MKKLNSYDEFVKFMPLVGNIDMSMKNDGKIEVTFSDNGQIIGKAHYYADSRPAAFFVHDARTDRQPQPRAE